MGDLFQAWVGSPRFETAEIAARRRGAAGPAARRACASTTSRATATSSSPAAPTPTPSTSWALEIAFEVGGVRYLAVHGDGLNDRDWQYRFWRWLSKSRAGPLRGAHTAARLGPADGRTRPSSALSQTNFKHKARAPRAAIRALRRAAAGRGARRAAARPLPRPRRLAGAGRRGPAARRLVPQPPGGVE